MDRGVAEELLHWSGRSCGLLLYLKYLVVFVVVRCRAHQEIALVFPLFEPFYYCSRSFINTWVKSLSCYVQQSKVVKHHLLLRCGNPQEEMGVLWLAPRISLPFKPFVKS